MDRLANPKVPMTLIILAATGAVCFTVGGGILLYHNYRSLLAASEWVNHTREVLLSVQRADQDTDRIDAETSYFLATKDTQSLDAAQTDTIALEAAAVHLKHLVSDNRNQDTNIDDLLSCSTALTQSLNAPGNLDAVKAEALRCKRTLALMREQETQLLNERTEASSTRSRMSLVTELSFVSISLVAVAILFSLLGRDALDRARIASQWIETNRELEQSHRDLAETMMALERHAKQTTLVAAFRDELQICATRTEVYHSASVRFPQLLPRTHGAFAVINNSRDTAEIVATWGESASSVSEVFPLDACCGLRAGQIRWRDARTVGSPHGDSAAASSAASPV